MYTLIFALLLALGVHSFPPMHGNAWQAQTAAQKMAQIWAATIENTQSLPWYGAVAEAELFIESMNISFDTVADDMPYQFFGLELRKKLIHTIGVLAQARLVITNNPYNYTGIFASGCDNALVRFSGAAQPADSASCTTGCFAPGISVKLLRNGVPSSTFLALFSLLGQPSYNFFAHDISTMPPDFGSWAPTSFQLVRAKFAEASWFPTMLGLSGISQYDQNGVPVSTPNFPFRVVFHPTTQWHNAFPDTWTGTPYAAQLMQKLSAGPLYDVYTQDDPLQPNQLTKLGTLILNGAFTTSDFGDRNYFMQHARWEDDGVLKPQWVPLAQQVQRTQQAAPAPGYTYPDLPWN